MILFSSKPAMRRSVFDFTTFAQEMPHTKLFLRDFQWNFMYHKGIEGLTDSIDETVEFLKLFLKRMKPKRVTFMGISAGGYAAALHAHLVGRDQDCRVDDVHVQGCYTFLDPVLRDRLGGGERFAGLFDNVANYLASRGEEHRYIDLAKVIADSPGAVKLMRMYYAGADLGDTVHAMRVQHFPHVQIVPHPSNSHAMLGPDLIHEGTLYRDIDMSVADLLAQNPPAVPMPHLVPPHIGPRGRGSLMARQG